MKKSMTNLLFTMAFTVLMLVVYPGSGCAAGAGEVLAEQNGLDGVPTIDREELAKLRGAAGDVTTTVGTNQDLVSTVIGAEFNADEIGSGPITIGEHAFDSFSGIGLVVSNTGNGVAIDAAIGVTFHLE